MKKKSFRRTLTCCAAAAALALLAVSAVRRIPLPAADLIIRIYFEGDIAGDSCSLYYATDTSGGFCEEQRVSSAIDRNRNMVAYTLDGSLDGQITALRLDWPSVEQLICVKSITLSSGGIIQKEFNPCVFFADENIASAHTASVTLVHPKNRAYLSTGTDDPHQILSAAFTRQITGCRSRYIMTWLFLGLFPLGSWLLARKKLFA